MVIIPKTNAYIIDNIIIAQKVDTRLCQDDDDDDHDDADGDDNGKSYKQSAQ